MNFEEIQSLWTGQPVPNLDTPKLVERQRELVSELKRRSRMLGYEHFCIAFGLISVPLLSILNFVNNSRVGTPLYWISFVLHLVALLAMGAIAVRRQKRHNELRRAHCGTLRLQAEVALANLNAECREYRVAPWVFMLWAVLSTLSIYNNTPFHGGTWEALLPRLGFVVALPGVVGAVLWRHYRVNLLPARERQLEILRELT